MYEERKIGQTECRLEVRKGWEGMKTEKLGNREKGDVSVSYSRVGPPIPNCRFYERFRLEEAEDANHKEMTRR